MKKTFVAVTLGVCLSLLSPFSIAQASSPVQGVVAHYAKLVHASYSDALSAAQRMDQAINEFLTAPSNDSLAKARKAWLDAREVYGQTEAYRFYGGPIDDSNGPEGRLNAWPMDESYVDFVEGNDKAGIINNRKQPITKKALAALNERDGEENIASGWHAIEFMLWGQDLSETGPGNRSYEDFVDGKKPNADRRRQYLKVTSALLLDDLRSLVKAWSPGPASNYRASFEKGGQESLRKIFVGLGSLSRGELAGERLEVALASQDQEDEHSCFSDNTHRDAVANARGIENVWLGEYKRPDGEVLKGPGLQALVAAKDGGLADKTTRQIRASVEAAEGIQAPFDREIVGGKDAPGRKRVQKTIDSLVEQSRNLVEAANAVGIKRLTLVQP
ncbi:imelysin family protein [Noviherbaspirillum sp. Root189]|uniref:imelysin family protein n=1 Tax=Noviherbaspirillum sp. Root189 TaxID=1736487 RepID=UPI00070A2FBF|nr:imelysin family protein [Noviherbaspirillum sp. Root189]KRB84029.1 iron-regulated protein [Noviherbaspirillum sp. Root189]